MGLLAAARMYRSNEFVVIRGKKETVRADSSETASVAEPSLAVRFQDGRFQFVRDVIVTDKLAV